MVGDFSVLSLYKRRDLIVNFVSTDIYRECKSNNKSTSSTLNYILKCRMENTVDKLKKIMNFVQCIGKFTLMTFVIYLMKNVENLLKGLFWV